MLFCITLGDWLGKGHDIKEDFLYDCNRPAAEIAAAYGMSREKYGVRFDGFRKDDPFAVWTRYGESGMSPEARGALERAGLLDGTGEPWRMRDRADLVMRFIALSMPAGFTYEPVVVPSLNGLLRADIGYGLFEGASCRDEGSTRRKRRPSPYLWLFRSPRAPPILSFAPTGSVGPPDGSSGRVALSPGCHGRTLASSSWP